MSADANTEAGAKAAAGAPEGEQQRTLNICNEKGLHARAAAKFVRCTAEFDALVTVAKDGLEVGGDSILGLMMLAACKGSSIAVSATGAQAAEVMDALTTLIDNRFDEEA